MDPNATQRIIHSLQNERAKLLAGMETNPYKRQEYEHELSQIEENIRQLHFSIPGFNSPHRTNNSPSGVIMDKFQPNQVSHDSGIVTRIGSPGFEDDDSSTESGSMLYRWEQAQQGACETTYPTHRVTGIEANMSGGQADRLKATLFPETLESNGVQATQIDTTKSTNVQRLTVSSQDIKQSLCNLLKHQSDTEVTSRVIPELLRVLQLSDRDIIEKAAWVVDSLAKKDASRHAILSCPKLIVALIHAVGTNVNDETAKLAANTLSTLSSKPQGRRLIHSCDGIGFLLSLLKSEGEYIVMFAITCLHNIFMCQNDSATYKETFRSKGGVQHLVRLLNGNRVKLLAIITDCLHLLACNNAETKLTIYEYNGPVLLVKMLTENTYEKLLWTIGRLLRILVLCPSNKHAIVQAGGLPALSKHLSNSSPRIAQTYLRSLLTLSDVARPEDNLEPMTLMLLNLLQGKCDVNMMTSAAGILSNITCNNPQNKAAICEHNGIQVLINIVICYTQKTDVSINTPQHNELLEGIVCTLRHVTSRHQRAEFAQNEVRLQKGLDLVLQLFLTTTHWTLIKACLGLLRNLSLSSTNRSELRRLSVIPQLIELLRRSLDILKKTADEINYEPQDGVNMEDVLVLVLSTVEILSRDAINRHMIGKQDIIPLLVALLYSERNRLIEHCAGCLCELAQDVYNIQVMERESCAEAMNKLMHQTQDETIVAYAAMTLHRLNEHRALDTHKMMNEEMLSGLMPMIPPGPGNVTPVGDLDYFPMAEDPNFYFYNPDQHAYAQTTQDHQMDNGHCIQIHPNSHAMTPSMPPNHSFPDPRLHPPPYFTDKPDYYDIANQQIQVPAHQQEAYFPQELGYGYNSILDYPPQTMREFYPTHHDVSQPIFRHF